jgi:hypothetical protein
LRLATNQTLSQERSNDLTFDFPKIFVLGEAENRLSIILASITVFWPFVTQKIQEIFITRECRAEGTYQLSSWPGRYWKDDDGRRGQYKGRRGTKGEDIELQAVDRKSRMEHYQEYQEDEVLEAGVRHPGRLVDVNSYTNALSRPFAEAEDITPTGSYQVRAATAPRNFA